MRLLAAVSVVALLFFSACQPTAPSSSGSPSAQAVVDSAIAAHEGTVLNRAVMTFDFRGDKYRICQNEGRFNYRRTYRDSLGHTVREGITYWCAFLFVAGDTVVLSPSAQNVVRTTVISVRYFAMLPEPLEDPAVQPKYSGRDTLNGVPYHRIQVTFREKGGGSDWQDVFMYWFRPDTYVMNYLSYAFGLAPSETDTGTRFREVYNVRRVNDVRVADYMNYTSDTLATNRMHLYPDLWEKDALELVSRVEIDSVQVQPTSVCM